MSEAKAEPAARPTQAQRRARSRGALLEAAARGLSRYGYGNLVLEDVAADAGYTRGALYHQFSGKEELALAVVAWIDETWWETMGAILVDAPDPATALLSIAREHAVFCRRDIARVRISLRVEFSGRDHPVGQAVEVSTAKVVAEAARLVTAARRAKLIPAGAPPQVVALAIVGAVEGVVVELAGQAPYDADLAERVTAGLLGVQPPRRRR